MGRYLYISGIVMAYAALQYGMAIAGCVILYKRIRSRDVYIEKRGELELSKKDILKVGILNLGMLLFLIISLFEIGSNIFA